MSWTTFSKANEIMNYLKTHLSPARAEKLDRLDIPVSSIAPADTALSNQIWTNNRAGNIDLMVPINLNLGNTDDVPDPWGSVHAKIKDIRDSIDPEGGGGTPIDYQFYTPSILTNNFFGLDQYQWVTLREINGSGIVTEALLCHTASRGIPGVINASGYRISVDNNIVMEGNFGGDRDNISSFVNIYQYLFSGFSLIDYVNSRTSVVPALNTTYITRQLFDLTGPVRSHPDVYSNHVVMEIKSFPSIGDFMLFSPGVAFIKNPVRFTSNFKIEVYIMATDEVYIQNSVYLL